MIDVRDNKDFNDYIESLLCKYESDDLEFKSAAGGFPGSFWDTYSAFANSDGGTIVFGVAEKKGLFCLDSLSDEQIEKYTKDFWNNVNNRSTISCNLLKSDDITVVEYKGHKIMLFYIPRATRTQRPVYRTTNPHGGTFKRNYEGDYKCTDREVNRMFADADEANPADFRILFNYTIEDIDREAVNKYRQLFKLSSPDHPWLSLDDMELLKKLGGFRKDRQTGVEGFTVAGLLMFGKTESITDPDCVPNFFPDYQERLTGDDDIRWTNRICPDGTWEANLFNFYQRVLPRLQSVLPKPFKLENNIRKEETPAHIAVREALVNLCIHADYSINASLLVKQNANGFIFSNPGTMLVSKEQFYTGGESVCRNKTLQKMFAMIGVSEKAGSGTDKIMKGWRDSNWRSPKVEEQLQPDKVILSMPMESLLSDNTKRKLTEIFGFTANSFDHDVLSILALASEEGYVTNERLRYSLNVHKTMIAETLKLMVLNKLLVSQGYGRGMRYYLPKESLNIFRDYSASSNGATSNSASSNSASSEGINHNGATSTKRRLSKKDLYDRVSDVCQNWVSLDEIVDKVQKSRPYLRNQVIPQMLKDRIIEMMHPGTPNHPQQKYKVKD